MRKQRWGLKKGFTIVELLIVIVVIAILAAIVIIVYNGVQERAKSSRRQADIANVVTLIENYNVEHGEYPKTTDQSQANWKSVDVRTDSNCFNGSKQSDWVPDITAVLPQSDGDTTGGVGGVGGCYLYASDGKSYVLSAWNMVDIPQTSAKYRRLGFREFQTSTSTQFYTCNNSVIGGVSGGSYSATNDYYKHSYTVSNIGDCDETPPPGA